MNSVNAKGEAKKALFESTVVEQRTQNASLTPMKQSARMF